MVVDACSAAAAAACAIFILPSRGKPALRRVTVELVQVCQPLRATGSARHARLGCQEASNLKRLAKKGQRRQDADPCSQCRPRVLMLRPSMYRRLELNCTATTRCYSTSARRRERPPPPSAPHTGTYATASTTVCTLLCKRYGPVREGCPFPAKQPIVERVPCVSSVQQRVHVRVRVVRMRCSRQPAALQLLERQPAHVSLLAAADRPTEGSRQAGAQCFEDAAAADEAATGGHSEPKVSGAAW